MTTKHKNIIGWSLLGLAIVGIIVYAAYRDMKPGQYDTFATCIEESGAKFYGAFWCPHCQNQKKMFGKSAKLLPYVECSTANGQGQLKICNDVGIQSYPTWIFADGIKVTGEQTFAQLSDKTKCQISS